MSLIQHSGRGLLWSHNSRKYRLHRARRLQGGQSSIPSCGTISWMSSGPSWNLINIKSPSSLRWELWDTWVMFVFVAPRTVAHPHAWSKASFELLFLIILEPNYYNVAPAGSWFSPRLPQPSWKYRIASELLWRCFHTCRSVHLVRAKREKSDIITFYCRSASFSHLKKRS